MSFEFGAKVYFLLCCFVTPSNTIKLAAESSSCKPSNHPFCMAALKCSTSFCPLKYIYQRIRIRSSQRLKVDSNSCQTKPLVHGDDELLPNDALFSFIPPDIHISIRHWSTSTLTLHHYLPFGIPGGPSLLRSAPSSFETCNEQTIRYPFNATEHPPSLSHPKAFSVRHLSAIQIQYSHAELSGLASENEP